MFALAKILKEESFVCLDSCEQLGYLLLAAYARDKRPSLLTYGVLTFFFASMASVVVCGQAGRMDAERSRTRWAFLFA